MTASRRKQHPNSSMPVRSHVCVVRAIAASGFTSAAFRPFAAGVSIPYGGFVRGGIELRNTCNMDSCMFLLLALGTASPAWLAEIRASPGLLVHALWLSMYDELRHGNVDGAKERWWERFAQGRVNAWNSDWGGFFKFWLRDRSSALSLGLVWKSHCGKCGHQAESVQHAVGIEYVSRGCRLSRSVVRPDALRLCGQCCQQVQSRELAIGDPGSCG
jgi:hypothetical protein